MKRPYLLAEVLLALVLLALLAPPLIGALKGRHERALSLSKKIDKIRQFDRVKLSLLEKISSEDLKVLEERGELDIHGAQLILKKDKIRIKDAMRTYLIECRAHGQKETICLSRRESRKIQPECTPHRQEGESRDSTQQEVQQ